MVTNWLPVGTVDTSVIKEVYNILDCCIDHWKKFIPVNYLFGKRSKLLNIVKCCCVFECTSKPKK